MTTRRLPTPLAVFILAAASLAVAGCSHPAMHPHGEDASSDSVTVNLQGQGAEAQAWMDDPNMHAFYDATVAAFSGGPEAVDMAAFEAKSRTIFHAFALSQGVDPAGMQDHLKAIPGEIVQIAKDDPHVLDSYRNFTLALFGPE